LENISTVQGMMLVRSAQLLFDKRPAMDKYQSMAPRVRRLAQSLDSLPGVIVSADCGGREIPSDNPADEFAVPFGIDPLDGGWYSLHALTYAAREFGDEIIEVVAGGGSPLFYLRGIQGADPNRLSEVIDDLASGDGNDSSAEEVETAPEPHRTTDDDRVADQRA
jgi:hypothetical protein